MPSQTLIQKTEGGPADKTYFDVQVFLDPFEGKAASLLAYGLPVEYAALMPISWDAEVQHHRMKPTKYLGLEDIAAPDGTLAGQLCAIGNSRRADVYGTVRRILKNALDSGWQPAHEELQPLGNRTLKINALKLYLYAQAYAANSVVETEAADRFGLTLDKLALLAVMQLLFHPDILGASLADPAALTSSGDLNRAVARRLTQKPGSRAFGEFTSILLLDAGVFLEFPQAEWAELLSATRNYDGPGQLLLPLDYLDAKLRVALRVTFRKELANLSADQKTKLEDLAKLNANPTLDFDFFYEAADAIRRNWEMSGPGKQLNVYKLPYRKTTRLLPVLEEIDVRPPLWVREAQALSIERALAGKRQSLALTALSTVSAGDDRQALWDEVRAANRTMFEVRRNIETLRDEVQDAGYKLTEGDLVEGSSYKQLSVTKEVTVVRRVEIARQAVETWTERYADRECFLFFCRNVYRFRNHSTVRHWTETRVDVETHSVALPVEWRPLDAFLYTSDAIVPARTYTVYKEDGTADEAATTETKQLVLSALNRAGVDLAIVKRGQKDVRHMTLHETGYRDQYGNSLDRILADAEDETVRARLLLLLPIQERRIDGELDTVKYVAIHNPIAPRAALVEPRVFLVETYANTLEQVPGHWLGPLSHSVCLFPGESRRLKLLSETRLVSQQRQENRSTHRNAVEQKASVRNQVRNDLTSMRKNAKQSNWSANASGGVNLGFVSFGGGAGGGENVQSSEETVSKDLLDRISESLQSASDSNEVQFATVSEATQTQSAHSEQVIEFQNVNQGRAVTHKFFQVLHKFRSGVELHDLRVVVEYGEPLIPGFDLYRTQTVKVSQVGSLFPELAERDRERVINRLKDLIVERAAGAVKRSEQGELELKSVELQKREWMVNSGAYFVETEVSEHPAVEKYIVDAREAEIERQRALASRIASEAEAIKSGALVLPSSESLHVTIQAPTPEA